MRYKDTVQPKRTRIVDRESWADLDKVDFDVHVRGSCWAVLGPFWFGRAFEFPPFFTYSVVEREPLNDREGWGFTCGIERWFLDERGVYLGANVWFAIIREVLGDAGHFGGCADLDVRLSWEGMSYKSYHDIYPDSHPKDGPVYVGLLCPGQTYADILNCQDPPVEECS